MAVFLLITSKVMTKLILGDSTFMSLASFIKWGVVFLFGLLSLLVVTILGYYSSFKPLIYLSLSKQVGNNWSSFVKNEVEGLVYTFKLVSDGIYYTESQQIDLKDGRLVKIEVYTKGYYLDYKGRLRWVFVPLVFRLPDGRLYRNGPYEEKLVDWSQDEILEKLPTRDSQSRRPEEVGGIKGEVMNTSIVLDYEARWEGRNIDRDSLPESIKIMADLQKRYLEIKKDEVIKFLKTGVTKDELIFPGGIVNASNVIEI